MTRRWNIAVLSRTTCWHGMHGGMDVHGKLLAEGLAARGHRVVIISTRHPSGKTYEIDNGVDIHYLNDTVFGSRRHGWAKKSVRALEALHGQQPFDLVWSQSYDGFGLTTGSSDVKQIPMLSTLHGSIQQEFTTFIVNIHRNWLHPVVFFKGIAGLLYSFFITQRPVLNHSRRIIAVSRRISDDLQKWFGKGVIEKCVTIYNGIDTKLFHPDPLAGNLLRRRFGIHENDVVVLTLGRITHEKGHYLLIEALAILKPTIPNIRLLAVGEGEGLPKMQALAERLNLSESVLFAGPVANQETVSFYNASDIFVFPTLTVEGLPFVMIEAMACGKPVIASDIGGNAEVIHDGENGILIKPGQPQLIADQIRILLSDRTHAECLGKCAMATVAKDFNVERMIDKTLNIMKDCIETNVFER